MTGEMHNIVVRAAIKALRQLPREEQVKLLGYDVPNLTDHFDWVEKYPYWRTKEDERAMDIIRRAAASMDGKVEGNA